jgi:hypothetical protein
MAAKARFQVVLMTGTFLGRTIRAINSCSRAWIKSGHFSPLLWTDYLSFELIKRFMLKVSRCCLLAYRWKWWLEDEHQQSTRSEEGSVVQRRLILSPQAFLPHVKVRWRVRLTVIGRSEGLLRDQPEFPQYTRGRQSADLRRWPWQCFGPEGGQLSRSVSTWQPLRVRCPLCIKRVLKNSSFWLSSTP